VHAEEQHAWVRRRERALDAAERPETLLGELLGEEREVGGDPGVGQELFERVTSIVLRSGDELFDGIARQDLEITKRVLDQITERALKVRAAL